MKKRTYLDANVLIAAFQGDEITSRWAMEVLDDPDRSFVISDFLKLEILPKPIFNKRGEEVEFMKTFCETAEKNVPCSTLLTKQAIDLASKYDIAPMDALHAGSALLAKVDEFITLEKSTKPIFRIDKLNVVSLLRDT